MPTLHQEEESLEKISCHIKEHSLLARMAAWKLGERQVAVTLGHYILLHNVSKEIFLNNERWLRHEICHVHQYRKYGAAKFLLLYLLESIKNGYINNKFEKEARMSEKEDSFAVNVHFI